MKTPTYRKQEQDQKTRLKWWAQDKKLENEKVTNKNITQTLHTWRPRSWICPKIIESKIWPKFLPFKKWSSSKFEAKLRTFKPFRVNAPSTRFLMNLILNPKFQFNSLTWFWQLDWRSKFPLLPTISWFWSNLKLWKWLVKVPTH